MFPFKLDTWLLDTNAEVGEEGIVLDNRFTTSKKDSLLSALVSQLL